MTQINTECPENFARVAQLLEYNSLMGSQFFQSSKKFAPCLCENAIEICPRIRFISGCHTLEADDFIGHEYFTIPWYDYEKIPTLYNTLISERIPFTINYNHPFHGYYPDYDDPSFVYTPENMEKKFINSLERSLYSTDHCDRYVAEYEIKRNSNIFDPWNYLTPEGKAFCERICVKYSHPLKPMDHPDNYKNWSWYRPLESIIHDALTVKSQTLQFVPDEENCMICLSVTPNTRALPCGHVVVCEECSRNLSRTADHKTCVRCRQPIERVMYTHGEIEK
jgi:hypothetical protein